MTDFDKYLRQDEPQKRDRGYAWQTAIGLQAVDGLKPSEYLIETARRHIEGEITIDESRQIIKSYYDSRETRSEKDRENLMANYLSPAIREGFVTMLYPDRPRHPRQKYLLTVKGLAMYNSK